VATGDETAAPLDAAGAGDVAARAPTAAATGGPLPAVIGGKYRPTRLIAKGGMGAVYEVVHANTGERLALKLMLARSLLTPELVERFRREARITSAIKDEHVVRVLDADVAREIDDVPFLVMELLEGRDFERVCLERKPTVAEVVDWMRQLARALDKAHQAGIVHRDLKPENLFLAEREGSAPIVKILDFGVAKIASEGEGQATATGQILGTPRYMAPEQAVDAKQISSAADRFALGLIAFRLLCGRHYFSGDNWVRLLRAVARGPQERPTALGSTLGPTFDTWFGRACAVEPRDRFATCTEQVEAMADALAGVASQRTDRRQLRRWIGAAALSGCGLAVALWGVGHRRATPDVTAPAAVRLAAEPTQPVSTTTPSPAEPARAAGPTSAPAATPGSDRGAPVALDPDGAKPLRHSSAPRPKRHDDATHRNDGRELAPPKPSSSSNRIWDEP
jgi:serine/threonine-protein kinase